MSGRPRTQYSTLSYTYYASGKVETITSSNTGGVLVSYAYDELNRLISVTDSRLLGNRKRLVWPY